MWIPLVEREKRPGSKKWHRGNSNPTLLLEYDSFSKDCEAATPACFAVLYQNKHGSIHVYHDSWPPTDFTGDQQKLRQHIR